MMKKQVYILPLIVFGCFIAVYFYFLADHRMFWKEYMNRAQQADNVAFIRNNNQIGGYTDEEIKSLPMVVSGELPEAAVKEDKANFKPILSEMIQAIKGLKTFGKTEIENEQLVIYGIKIDDNSFLYIYENGTAMIGMDGKYYVYQTGDYQKLDEKWAELTKSYTTKYEDIYYHVD